MSGQYEPPLSRDNQKHFVKIIATVLFHFLLKTIHTEVKMCRSRSQTKCLPHFGMWQSEMKRSKPFMTVHLLNSNDKDSLKDA